MGFGFNGNFGFRIGCKEGGSRLMQRHAKFKVSENAEHDFT